jgi:hypothetical protein
MKSSFLELAISPASVKGLSQKARLFLRNEYKNGKGFWHYFSSFCVWFSNYIPAPSSTLRSIADLANRFDNKKDTNKDSWSFPMPKIDSPNHRPNDDDE